MLPENISEEEISLDCSLMNSLDFSRAMQNLSNQNLEELLELEATDAYLKVSNLMDNNNSTNGLND